MNKKTLLIVLGIIIILIIIFAGARTTKTPTPEPIVPPEEITEPVAPIDMNVEVPVTEEVPAAPVE